MGSVSDFAAFGFGEEREEGTDAGVERDYAITTWSLNVALRRVGHRQPVEASLPHHPVFLRIFRNAFGHSQGSGIVW